MTRNRKDLTGSTYGRLTVLQAESSDKHQKARWRCRCICGVETVVIGSNLLRGSTTSCGCFHRQQVSSRRKTHGESVSTGSTAEYRTWRSIINRCENPRAVNYKDYGGRGITVCVAWRNSYETFLEDMGRRPSAAHSIERRDVNGPYRAENCYWATRKEQGCNRRDNHWLTFNGQTKIFSEWYRSGELSPLVLNRLRRGWSPEDAIHTARGVPRQKSHRGRSTMLA